ncbi:phospholipase D alpha 1-like [Phragmites australis]|uniref:phospholipase D alpha 1-like n=1 Tax=Phragmites australis TaxID=29695 RepID=UPI002D78BB28|nr:phospholipase D alpha 1-like [Phragmites australis]
MAQMLLHGVIDAKILEADLSVTSGGQLKPAKKTMMKRKAFSWIKKLPFCKCQRLLENAIGLDSTAGKLYATVDIDKARVGRTRMLDPVYSPQWKESFHIYCAHYASNVIFTVKADNTVGATLIGRAYLPTANVIAGQQVDQWLPICDEKRQPLEGGDQIHVQLRFTDVTADPAAGWGAGVGSAAYPGVPRTFFGQHRGCRVRLYEDAHISDGFAPRIRLAGNRFYEPRRCWEDVFEAITNARRMVYIAGWSVNTDVVLVRDPRRPSSGTLGELLKQKAHEGVTVLMLVWNDRTSVGLGPIKRDGLMATHDEDTASYFRGTGVRCVLCPRNPDQGRSYVQDVETATMFTHHQKTVIVDGGNAEANAPPGLVSFLGGIDLCDGRYDTQEHPLFRTLGTTHRNDFHQPNFPGASIKRGGPREPWHDIHCRVEGPATWDVLENFEQRWRRQGDGDNFLVTLDKGWAAREASEDAESWNVQVFRSIDGGAAAGFPENPDEAARCGLVTGKDNVIERSIQDAYIHAIRRARDFIYIENQYFLGSSYAWQRDDGVTVAEINALHLIPKELSLKIVSKIEAGERFAVYVVVPMWPEGIPESGSVQAILDWQRRTMEMMYKDVALAIRAKGLQANPRDYLTFFCLGNREADSPGEYVPPERPDPDSDYERAQQARRFMIYVHAKTMIVDDEYIIVGSANINQRSMDGGRDSEIAMGAYQPGHLASRNRLARGQVHGFRVALWQEHLGRTAAADGADKLLKPSSLACVRRMNQVAEQHWKMFADDTFRGDLPGHLMAYPVGVGNDGELLETTACFPDTKARVFGNKSTILPPILTT